RRGIWRGSLLAVWGAVNPAPRGVAASYTESNAPGRTPPTILRGAAHPLGVRAQSRSPPDHRRNSRHGVGRGRNLQPVTTFVRAPLLVLEGRAGSDPLRNVPPERARAHVRPRERPAGAGPRPREPLRGPRRVPADRRFRGGGRRGTAAPPVRGAQEE